MKSLHELSLNADKNFAHQYIHVYEGLLEPIRFTAQNVLEIGINTGNSHRMWRDYFPDATVYGVDLFDFCDGMKDEERIEVRFGNAYTPGMVNSFSEIKFDVIVDDGPHSLESQVFCVENYTSLLSNNGILIIEDIPYPEWIRILAQATPHELQKYSYGIDRRWVPDKNTINDELIFIIDKRYVK
jgi:hypothetical protein